MIKIVMTSIGEVKFLNGYPIVIYAKKPIHSNEIPDADKYLSDVLGMPCSIYTFFSNRETENHCYRLLHRDSVLLVKRGCPYQIIDSHNDVDFDVIGLWDGNEIKDLLTLGKKHLSIPSDEFNESFDESVKYEPNSPDDLSKVRLARLLPLNAYRLPKSILARSKLCLKDVRGANWVMDRKGGGYFFLNDNSYWYTYTYKLSNNLLESIHILGEYSEKIVANSMSINSVKYKAGEDVTRLDNHTIRDLYNILSKSGETILHRKFFKTVGYSINQICDLIKEGLTKGDLEVFSNEVHYGEVGFPHDLRKCVKSRKSPA